MIPHLWFSGTKPFIVRGCICFWLWNVVNYVFDKMWPVDAIPDVSWLQQRIFGRSMSICSQEPLVTIGCRMKQYQIQYQTKERTDVESMDCQQQGLSAVLHGKVNQFHNGGPIQPKIRKIDIAQHRYYLISYEFAWKDYVFGRLPALCGTPKKSYRKL